jgi:hypothetical protein
MAILNDSLLFVYTIGSRIEHTGDMILLKIYFIFNTTLVGNLKIISERRKGKP